MRSVAKAARVATSTVSKALRDDPTISELRRYDIQQLARSMGYRPNPLVAALMSQLHVRRRRNDPNHIAWIDLWPSERDASRLPLLKPLFRGVLARARELGYGIEIHKVGRDRIAPDRLRQILLARSQWGLIIPPVPETASRIALNMQGLTGVAVGTSLHEPVLHRVSPNLYQGSQLACTRLRELGFRRIAMVLSPFVNTRVEGRWLGAYLAEQVFWPKNERLPPLLAYENDDAKFRQWFQRFRPDVILLSEPHVERWLSTYYRKQRKSVQTAWLLLETEEQNIQGIDYRGEKIGAAAVEKIVAQIHRNERGVPEIPNTLLVDGVWRNRSPERNTRYAMRPGL